MIFDYYGNGLVFSPMCIVTRFTRLKFMLFEFHDYWALSQLIAVINISTPGQFGKAGFERFLSRLAVNNKMCMCALEVGLAMASEIIYVLLHQYFSLQILFMLVLIFPFCPEINSISIQRFYFPNFLNFKHQFLPHSSIS